LGYEAFKLCSFETIFHWQKALVHWREKRRGRKIYMILQCRLNSIPDATYTPKRKARLNLDVQLRTMVLCRFPVRV
jgi:hypothetical protein